MSNHTPKIITKEIAQKKKQLAETSIIKLQNILYSEECLEIISTCRDYRDRIFTPAVTISMFLQQVLSPDKSCRNAVSKFISQSLVKEDVVCSQNTGPYTKARDRIPVATIKALALCVGNTLAEASTETWQGFIPIVVDGTTFLMPDTKENQSTYPQHSNQKEGAGFPIARMVLIFDLFTGAALDYAVDAYKGKGTGEHSLLRKIMSTFKEGHLMLGDAYYPSFFVLAELKGRKCEGVFEGAAQRNYDFRKGKKLGVKDHIVMWDKPKKPLWMDQETYNSYPSQIEVRECKANGKIFVTTLLNKRKYPKKEIAELYNSRWHVELNIGNIKTVMNMEMLSCKKPEMVQKEIDAHILGYNIIRTLMAEAGTRYGMPFLKISFKATIQHLLNFSPLLVSCDKKMRQKVYEQMLLMISGCEIGNRPGRQEPRAVKRRPKSFPLLNMHRKNYKENKKRSKYATA